VTTSIGYDTQPLLLGRDTENGVPRFFLQGQIDQAAIYARARLIAEAGCKGGTITVLDSVEFVNSHIPSLIIADLLKRLGLNVELVSADWSAISARRASKKPPDEGGWNVFGTTGVGSDTLDPNVNVMLQANGDAAWFGWPKDDTIEALRAQ